MTDEGQQIRDLVWDYVYGLLSPEENQEMVARIKSDPQVARLYAEVCLKGELVAEAALVEDSTIKLSPEGVITKPKVEPARSASKKVVAASKRNANWLSIVAASALAALLAAGFLWPRPDERLLAHNFVCADVVSPSSLPAGLTNQVVVNTFRVNASGDAERGATAAVQLRLVDRAGKEQFQKSLQTDESGQATIELPGAALEPGVKLEVLASAGSTNAATTRRAAEEFDRYSLVAKQKNNQSLVLTTELPVEPEPQIAYSLAAEPEVDAAKEVPVSIWNFAAFSSKPTPADEAESINQLSDARSRDLGNRDLEKATTAGAASTTSSVQQFGARAAGRAVGGQLRTENRAKQEPPGQQVAQVVGAGQPVQMDISPALAGKTLDVSVMCRGVTVAASTEMDDSAARATPADDRKAQSGQRQVTLSLPPEADGLLEVEVFDQASDQPEPVQRALVFRQPLKKLQVELSDFRERVAPGSEVEVKLRVTDEKGQPAANTRLGVRVWNERLVKQLGERPLLVTDAVRNSATSDYVSSENVPAETFALNQANRADLTRLTQQSNRYQRALRTPSGAPVAGEDLQRRQMNESQQMVRSTAANPKIELASNRQAVKVALQTASDEAEASRRRAIRLLGMTAMVGGAVVLLLVAALAALRVTSGARTLAVPLVTALASLLIGTAWLGWLPDRSATQIAMVESGESNSAPAESRTPLADAVANMPVPATAAAPPVAEPAARRARGPEVPADVPLAAAPATQPAATALSAGPLSGSAGVPLGGSAGLAGGGIPAPGGFAAGKAEGGEKAKEAATEKLAEKKLDDNKDNSSKPTSPPPSLYFNPNLETDANGVATVRFNMPAAPSEYRVLIDAIGQGRIGSRQELIVAE